MRPNTSSGQPLIWRRIAAGATDVLILLTFSSVFAVGMPQEDPPDELRSPFQLSNAAVLFALVSSAYFVALESIWGRTIGKLVFDLRVMREDGSRPGFGRIVVRNAFRIVDWLPLFYLIGLVVVVSNGGRQRVGDLVAGTVVDHSARMATDAPSNGGSVQTSDSVQPPG